MGKNERTITSAKVTITLELFDLGTFGPGSLIEQAKMAAASQLSVILATVVDPAQVLIESVSTTNDGVAIGKIEAIRS